MVHFICSIASFGKMAQIVKTQMIFRLNGQDTEDDAHVIQNSAPEGEAHVTQNSAVGHQIAHLLKKI